MSFPWNRRPTAQARPVRAVPAQRTQRVDRRLQRSRVRQEQRRQRLAIIIGVAIILIILAIPAYGYYNSFFAPPRMWAAKIRETTYTMGDLVKRIRMLQAITSQFGSPIDLSTVPFQTLFDMMQGEIARQAAPQFGISVTNDEVREAVRQNFYPRPPEGQETNPGQLDREFQERYRGFLTSTRLSDKEYTKLVEENLYRKEMREELGKRVPSVGERVEVYWMRLPSERDALGGQGINPQEVRKRLEQGEDFGKVAGELSIDRYADDKGYVGWVPKGAFPALDEVLFGSKDKKPIEHNTLSEPIFTPEGTYILKVVNGPEVGEISNNMKERLKDQAFQTWIQEQQSKGSDEGWLKINFNSDLYAWVTKQVRLSAPREKQKPPAGSSR